MRHEFLISRIYQNVFFSQVGLIYITPLDSSKELHALESRSPYLLAILHSLYLISIEIDFKVFEDTSEMARIWHVLHHFSAKVRECWQVEIVYLFKYAIDHHISKINWPIMHQQVGVNEVLIGERRLRMPFGLQNPGEKKMNHLPKYP